MYTALDDITPPKPTIEDFWTSETIMIGITDNAEGDDVDNTKFHETIKYINNCSLATSHGHGEMMKQICHMIMNWPWTKDTNLGVVTEPITNGPVKQYYTAPIQTCFY